MKKNVLFFSPTFYELPLSENIKKKYNNLSEVANITVLAFSSQKKIYTQFISLIRYHPKLCFFLKGFLISMRDDKRLT